MRLLPLVRTAFVLCVVGSAALAQGRPAAVETEVVAVRQMTETVTVFGQVVAERESAVASRVAGIVADIPIRIGTQVQKGDILAQMDTELLQIEMARAETELAIAEAGLGVAQVREDSAEKVYRRAESLRENSTIADAQFEDRAAAFAEARAARQEAMARVASARNAIDRARYNLTNATVRAPFDGVVLEVSTELGQFVAQGSEVAVLLDTGALEVLVNVPARLSVGLSPGLTVDAKTESGRGLRLVLRAALPTEFSATRTRPALFALVDPTDAVAVGQSITLNVPVGAVRDVVTVPKDALVQARGGWTAFVNEGGKAAPRTVEIGASLGNRFEVLSGLEPGDEVVVRGNERLRPGQDIAPAGAPPPAAGQAPASPSDEGNNTTSVAESARQQG